MSNRSAENLNRMGSVAGVALKEGATYPVNGLNGVGVEISNNDPAVDMILEISGVDIKGTFTNEYRVPGGATLNTLLKPFSSINLTQEPSAYDIIIKEPIG